MSKNCRTSRPSSAQLGGEQLQREFDYVPSLPAFQPPPDGDDSSLDDGSTSKNSSRDENNSAAESVAESVAGSNAESVAESDVAESVADSDAVESVVDSDEADEIDSSIQPTKDVFDETPIAEEGSKKRKAASPTEHIPTSNAPPQKRTTVVEFYVVNERSRTAGVFQTSSGTLVVNVDYQGATRYFGTHSTREQAELANRVALQRLEPTDGLELTAREIEMNVKLAKDFVARTLSALKDGAAAEAPIATDMRGVTKTPNGNWDVRLWYQGTMRYFGTHRTRERAALASGVVQQKLEPTRGLKLTDGEIDTNVELAKNAVVWALSELKDKAATKAPNDTDIIGATLTPNGNWRVQICYQGKTRYFGTHITREQAALASRVVQQSLKATSGLELTAREIETNVKLAKDAVARALSGSKDDGTAAKAPNTAGMLSGTTAPNGNWRVRMWYQGTLRYFGTHSTREQAALASQVVQQKLEPTRGLKLTPREIKSNVKLAKDAVTQALSELKDGTAAKDTIVPAMFGGTTTPNGNWNVQMWYQGTMRYFGTHSTREQAALASRVVQQKLEPTSGLELTADEIDTNVELAKDAVTRALSDLKDDGTAAGAPNDIDMLGVREKPNGNWNVQMWYQGTMRYFGTHSTREQAALASRVVQQRLKATRGPKLTADEIDTNLILAKNAVDQALSEMKNDGTAAGAPNAADMLGVKKMYNGNWKVQTWYQGKCQYVGMFSTREQAALASRVVQQRLEPTRGLNLTPREIKSNMKLAKKAVDQALSEMKNDGTAAGASNAADMLGVREMPNGKWNVQTWYHETSQHVGTYSTREQAVLASRVVQQRLKATRSLKLTAGEIKSNMKLAKNAVTQALSEMKNDGTAAKAPIATDMLDVKEMPNGKWKVQTWYQEKSRHVGTYSTREQAALASRVVQQKLKATSGLKLTAGEIKSNMKLAKNAVTQALPELKDGTAAKAHNAPDIVGVSEYGGKWKVQMWYQKKNQYFGLYSTREQALLVNQIVRQKLEATSDLKLTADETELNVKMAKDAGARALSESKDGAAAKTPNCPALAGAGPVLD